MSFFNQMGGMGGASPMLGGGGQSAGLMGAGGGMNPQLMQLLMAMQNRQGQGQGMPGQAPGAPQLPGAPQAMGAPSAGMMPHIPPVPQQPGIMQQMQAAGAPAQSQGQGQGQGLMALLAQMNPQMLQRLLSGGGGAGV